MNDFDAPERFLRGLDARAAGALITAASDVALLLDADGVIRDVAVGADDLVLDGSAKWVGRPWIETVTVESRPKVEELLHDAAALAQPRARRWRQLNHPSSRGSDVPVLYAAMRLGDRGQVVALGRDLRAVAVLQQRLVEAQQAMERDYLRLRHLETRYRLLFQMGSEAVLIVDASSQQVLEANPAAARLLDEAVKRLTGRPLLECFDAASRDAVAALLGRVPMAGSLDEVAVTLADGTTHVGVSVSLFRQEGGALLLVRLALPEGSPRDANGSGATGDKSRALKALEAAPDGFVVTDLDGRILSANGAFAEMAQLMAPELLRGESLDRWLGRTGVDLSVLIANLRQQGSVRLFASTLRGQHGTTVDVEISAAAVPYGPQPCLAFVVRDVGLRLNARATPEPELSRSVGHLTKLVGRVPLKDIVGETTDLIEKLCIEAALELTRDNRASAAEMLGLSRQSLYVKLRRHGLGDLGDA